MYICLLTRSAGSKCRPFYRSQRKFLFLSVFLSFLFLTFFFIFFFADTQHILANFGFSTDNSFKVMYKSNISNKALKGYSSGR